MKYWLWVCLICTSAMGCGDDDESLDAGRVDSGRIDSGRPDAPPICGDGFCEGAEDSMSCAADCGCSCDVDFECTAGCDCDVECTDECVVARCEGGVAVTCDGEISLDCNSFGSSCTGFVDSDTGQEFSWCGCAGLSEGAGSCFDTRDLVVCEDGIALPGECAAGTSCDAGGGVVGCVCDNVADGVCPDAVCTADPDCSACTPDCSSAVCGDNGCGGSCGDCSLGERCDSGACTTSCTPNCAGRVCGSNGCGGSCGSCTSPASCNAVSGLCESECVPSCDEGQTCGSDGCGGRCGSPCPADRDCRDCPSGGSCAVDTYTCRCDFFSRVEYTFDASGLDWTDINAVSINYRHVNIDGTFRTPAGAFLTSGDTTENYSPPGCEPQIEVKREYSVRGGRSCEITETLTQTNIVIPQPVFDADGGCTAPPLL